MEKKLKHGIDFVGITTTFYCHDGKGNFLLHKRQAASRDECGVWDTGGGKLEHGMTLRENVLKEIEEEYGVKGKIDEELPRYEIFREHEGKKTHWIAFPFIVRIDPKKVRNLEPHKIAEFGWFKFGKFPKPLHTGCAIGLKQNKKYFQKYAK